jgi:hypothetical protein
MDMVYNGLTICTTSERLWIACRISGTIGYKGIAGLAHGLPS